MSTSNDGHAGAPLLPRRQLIHDPVAAVLQHDEERRRRRSARRSTALDAEDRRAVAEDRHDRTVGKRHPKPAAPPAPQPRPPIAALTKPSGSPRGNTERQLGPVRRAPPRRRPHRAAAARRAPAARGLPERRRPAGGGSGLRCSGAAGPGRSRTRAGASSRQTSPAVGEHRELDRAAVHLVGVVADHCEVRSRGCVNGPGVVRRSAGRPERRRPARASYGASVSRRRGRSDGQ